MEIRRLRDNRVSRAFSLVLPGGVSSPSRKRAIATLLLLLSFCLFLYVHTAQAFYIDHTTVPKVDFTVTDLDDKTGTPTTTAYVDMVAKLPGNRIALFVNTYDDAFNLVKSYVRMVTTGGATVYTTDITTGTRLSNSLLRHIYGLSGGNVVVTWEGTATAQGGAPFQFLIIDPSGTIIKSATDINDGTSTYNAYTGGAELSNGNIAFFYQADNPATNYRLRIFNPSGTSVAGPSTIPKVTGCTAPGAYSIAANRNGKMMLTSYCNDGDTSSQYFGVLYNNDGTISQVGGANVFNLSTVSRGTYPASEVTALSNDNFAAIYLSGTGNVMRRIFQPDGTAGTESGGSPTIPDYIGKIRGLNEGGFLHYLDSSPTVNLYDNSGNLVEGNRLLDTNPGDPNWDVLDPGRERGFLYWNYNDWNRGVYTMHLYAPPPAITSVTYNAAAGVLAVAGLDMVPGDIIAVNKLTLTGEGGQTYTLTTGNVTASSAPSFSVTLNATDKAAVNQIINKNGTASTGGTTYNLAAADDWDTKVTSGDTSDAINTVTASNVPVPPTITTNAASSVTASGATLNGQGNPNGTAATGWFRYSTTDPGACDDTFGTRAPTSGGASLGSGSSAAPYSQAISGLNPGTTYYFCAIGSNPVGTTFGAVMSFTTQAVLPSVTTNGATSLTGTTAQLNGTANPGGESATGWFRYDTANPGACNDTFGTRAPATGGSSLGSGNSAQAYSQAISGLTPGTSYYYCAIGQNSVGTAFGSVVSFTTQPPNHTVTFNANLGSGTMTPQTANTPTVLSLNAFTRTGYSFSGWDTVSDGSGVFYADGATCSFTEDATLYAQWLATPTATAATGVTDAGFTANWGAVSGATGYYMDVATDSSFTGFVSGYQNRDVGSSTSVAVSGLAPGSGYHYRVRAYIGYVTTVSSNTIDVTTLPGRVTGIVIDPNTSGRLFAAVDGGGVYASADSGGSWNPTTSQPASNRLKAMLLRAPAYTVLFAASYGSGVFTSADGGSTWSACTGQPANRNVLSLACDAIGNLYVGTESGIFTSSDCGTWTAVNGSLTPDPSSTPPVTIVIDPTTSSTLYAGLDGAGVWKSTNSGGLWTAATTQPANLRIKALVINKSDNTKLFAATYGGGVFKSVNSGVVWTACANTGLTNLNTLSLTIDGNGRLYVGTEAGVFVSADGGATWNAFNSGLP
ncbi:MAG TPA: InlB B-repeat-containing protein [Geobacteraceae bacterium]|nr:InlB B-repeat-containing protein [Geobacteraceae bacterium]